MAYTDPQSDDLHIRTPWKKVVEQEQDAELVDLERHATLHRSILGNLEESMSRLKTASKTGKYYGGQMDSQEANLSYQAQFKRYTGRQRQLKDVEKDIERIKGKFRTIGAAAEKVHTASSSVETKSGKNKLYVGNRRHVLDHTEATKGKEGKKRARILDSTSWSWGLNLAWVQGGVKAEAEFKIKTDAANPWASLPQPVEDEMRWNARMSAARWLELCQENKGRGNMLWVTSEDQDRPSWTALEIAACLESGYRFEFRNRDHHPGQKIVLTK